MMLALGSNFEGHELLVMYCEEQKTWYVDDALLKKALGLDDASFATLFNDAQYRIHESKRVKDKVFYLIPTIDVYLALPKHKLALWLHDEEFIYLPRRLNAKKGVLIELMRRLQTTKKHLERSISLYGKKGARATTILSDIADNLEEKIIALNQHGMTPQNDAVLAHAVELIEEARRNDAHKAEHQ